MSDMEKKSYFIVLLKGLRDSLNYDMAIWRYE